MRDETVKCDKCGSLCTDRAVSANLIDPLGEVLSFDLCPPCAHQVQEYILNKPQRVTIGYPIEKEKPERTDYYNKSMEWLPIKKAVQITGATSGMIYGAARRGKIVWRKLGKRGMEFNSSSLQAWKEKYLDV